LVFLFGVLFDVISLRFLDGADVSELLILDN